MTGAFVVLLVVAALVDAVLWRALVRAFKAERRRHAALEAAWQRRVPDSGAPWDYD